MTDKPRTVRHSSDEQGSDRVVIRDKRKIDPAGGRHASPNQPDEDDLETTEEQAKAADGTEESTDADPESPEQAKPKDGSAEGGSAEGGAEPTGGAQPEAGAAPKGAGHEGGAGNEGGAKQEGGGAKPAAGLGAELQALRAELDERTRDLQRLSAEYANYRKRMDRDRGLAAERTTGNVLTALLPILDDLDRARDHGDLVGPFGSVAEQLNAALAKFGLTAFGEKGDRFDPTRHEAVAHRTSPDVSEPTCVEVMRRGYLLGERLLRAALVTVADPE
jgi:molecular chaperone GrpE